MVQAIISALVVLFLGYANFSFIAEGWKEYDMSASLRREISLILKKINATFDMGGCKSLPKVSNESVS